MARPLLVIAAAGSRKINTFAHLGQPDRQWRRCLSRPPDDLPPPGGIGDKQAGRKHLRQGLGTVASIRTDALTWAAMDRAIGIRLLRKYVEQIDLPPSFTIKDRENSADLINLFRYQLDSSQTASRFPTKGTWLPIYSRAVNAEMPLRAVRRPISSAALPEARLREMFAGYVEAKRAQGVLDNDHLALYWAQRVSDQALAAHITAKAGGSEA